jgi:hypothetical protein
MCNGQGKEVALCSAGGNSGNGFGSEISSLDNGRIFFAHEIQNNDTWMDKAIDLLSEHVYITIDLDVLILP